MRRFSEYKQPGLLTAIVLGCMAGFPVSATGAPRPTQFGMLGFSGYMQPAWPDKPVAVKVAKVHPDSPAFGILNVGDVIVGVGNERFPMDPRPGLANAIDYVE